MSREVRRVPLDFDWPPHKVWEGFVNPHYSAVSHCPDCAGSGYSPEAKWISDQWYGTAPFNPVAYGAVPLTVDHPAVVQLAKRNCERAPQYYGQGPEDVTREARRLFNLLRSLWCHHLIQADVDALVAADRLWNFTHVPRTDEQREVVRKKVEEGENSWLPESNGYTPTADEVNAWSIGGFGHDSINSGVCLRARCEREGVTLLCARCLGESIVWSTPEAKAAYEGWETVKPPVGPGWQVWETVSEGSPVTPVFATEKELVDYLVDESGYSWEGAANFVKSGYAVSGIIDEHGMRANIETCNHMTLAARKTRLEYLLEDDGP